MTSFKHWVHRKMAADSQDRIIMEIVRYNPRDRSPPQHCLHWSSESLYLHHLKHRDRVHVHCSAASFSSSSFSVLVPQIVYRPDITFYRTSTTGQRILNDMLCKIMKNRRDTIAGNEARVYYFKEQHIYAWQILQ